MSPALVTRTLLAVVPGGLSGLDLIVRARQIAFEAHAGQVDAVGEPYIEHPARVAARVAAITDDAYAIAAAWLHDVVEDNPAWTPARLYAEGIPKETLDAVVLLTHRDEPYLEYVAAAASHSTSALVKRCDLADNSRPERLARMPAAKARRKALRYAGAHRVLDAASEATTAAVRVRREHPADFPAIAELLGAAFGRPDEAALVARLRQDPAYLPDLTLVAEASDGRVVGFVMLSRMTVGDNPAVALAPLAVGPDQQRQGVGGALALAALAAADRAGEALAVVLGNPAYYARFGFSEAAVLEVTGVFGAAGPAWRALPLFGASKADDAPTGVATYAAAFGL